MKKNKLTIVIPVYNTEKYVEETILSVLNQSFSNFELVIINDGSLDRSGEILQHMRKKDSRVTIIQQDNRGLSAVRNRGMDFSNSEYIYFLDSDDVLVDGSLEKVMNLAESTNCDMVHFSSYSIDAEGNRITKHRIKQYRQLIPLQGEKLLYELYSSKNYHTNVQKYIFRKQFLRDHNLRFDDGYIHEDEAFTLEALCLAKKVTSIDEPLLKKRFRAGSIMSSKKNEYNIESYAKAVSRLIQFMDKHSFNKETQYIIRSKIRQITLRCIHLIYTMNESDNGNRKIEDYFATRDVIKAGWDLYFKSKVYGPYQAVKKHLP